MAEINQIIDPKAIEDILKTSKALNDLDAAMLKFIQDQQRFANQINANANASASATEQASAYQKTINDTAASQKQLSESEKIIMQQKKQLLTIEEKITLANTELNAELMKKQATLREENELVKINNTFNDKNAGTLQKAAALNKLLQKEKLKLNLTTEEGRKRLIEINEQQDENNRLLKESGNAAQQQSANVGNYKSAFGGLVEQFKAGEIGAKGLVRGIFAIGKAFIVAIVSNPVLLVVGLIVGAITGLIAAFKRTKAGADLFAQAGAYIKGIMSGLIGLVDKFAKFIGNAFKDPIGALKDLGKAIVQNLINRLLGIVELGKAVGNVLKSIVNRDLDGLKDAAKDAGQAVIQMSTGLDAEQQNKFGDAISETTKKIAEQAATMAKLEKQKQKNIAQNREYETQLARINAQEELLTAIADDATKSFAEREKAAEAANKKQEEAAAISLKMAKNNLSVIAEETKIRQSNGENIEELLDAQKDAQIALIEAEKNYTMTIRENEKQRSELKQDRLEKDLDILIDGFDNQKTINEKIIANEKYTFEERQKKLDETVKLGQDAFQKQGETIQQFTQKQIDFNDLLATSDAVQLNEKIRALGLSEIIEGRLLEVVRERRMVESDLAEAQQGLDESVSKSKQDALKKDADEYKKASDERAKLMELEYNRQLFLIRANSKNEEEFAAKKFELDKSVIAKSIEGLQILLESTELSAEQRLDIEVQLAQKRLELQGLVWDDEKAKNEERKEAMQEIADQSIEIANLLFEYQSQNYQNQLEILERKNTNGLLSDKEYAKEKAILENKMAKSERNAALFNIAINTAQAVSKIWAEVPKGDFGVTTLIMTGLAIAAGAIQAATVLSKPLPEIPAFAKGTENAPNTFIAGERGRELMMLKSGELIMVNQATVFSGNQFEGAKIQSNPETEWIMNRTANPNFGQQNRTDERLLKSMKSVEQAIKDKPVFIFDERRRVVGSVTGNSTKRYVNRYNY